MLKLRSEFVLRLPLQLALVDAGLNKIGIVRAVRLAVSIVTGHRMPHRARGSPAGVRT